LHYNIDAAATNAVALMNAAAARVATYAASLSRVQSVCYAFLCDQCHVDTCPYLHPPPNIMALLKFTTRIHRVRMSKSMMLESLVRADQTGLVRANELRHAANVKLRMQFTRSQTERHDAIMAVGDRIVCRLEFHRDCVHSRTSLQQFASMLGEIELSIARLKQCAIKTDTNMMRGAIEKLIDTHDAAIAALDQFVSGLRNELLQITHCTEDPLFRIDL
jgi:hypothetical protein